LKTFFLFESSLWADSENVAPEVVIVISGHPHPYSYPIRMGYTARLNMNKPDAVDEANENHRPKNKTLNHFGFIKKCGLLGAKSPGLHTDKKIANHGNGTLLLLKKINLILDKCQPKHSKKNL
jgi:hypothetical protein